MMRPPVVLAIHVVAVAAGSALSLIIAGSLPDDAEGWLFATVFSLLFLVLVPAVAVTLVSSWLVDPATEQGRRVFRSVILVLAGVQLLSAVLLITAVSVNGLDPVLPVAVIAVGGLATLAGVAGGERMRRRGGARAAPKGAWQPPPREEVVRTWRGFVSVFVIAFLVVAGGLGVTFVLTGRGLGEMGLYVALQAAAFASFAALVVLLRATWRFTALVQAVYGGNIESQRKVARAVVRGKPVSLDADERSMAARYLPIAEYHQPFQLAQVLVLLVGVSLNHAANLVNADDDVVWYVALLLVTFLTLLIAVVTTTRQRANIRRYRREHGDVVEV
jgi:MFS family permease